MKTAFQQLMEALDDRNLEPHLFTQWYQSSIKNLKRLDKQQIIDAWQHGSIRTPKTLAHINNAELYYNTQFNEK
jgi:hypothetical protein